MGFLLQIGFGQQSWACGNSSHTRAQLNRRDSICKIKVYNMNLLWVQTKYKST